MTATQDITAFQVAGDNAAALFTLKLHRGEGMVLLAMNWRGDRPSDDFVGFAIEYKQPGDEQFYAVKNRLNFLDGSGHVDPVGKSTRESPIQKFRWVHFPRNAALEGQFVYRVTPVFMDGSDALSYGEAQQASVVLRRETYPGQLNVAFTRGFVSSQAFVDRYESAGDIATLLPATADDGLTFVPTHPKADEAYRWMGFEAREVLLDVLSRAIADPTAQVCVIAYDLNEKDVVGHLQQLGSRLRVIIDDSADHGKDDSCETVAAGWLRTSAGEANVKRQHMGNLQHNKVIVVNGEAIKAAVCGSTNFSWRGLYVQANNAIVVRGEDAITPFLAAFESYWNHDGVGGFAATSPAQQAGTGLPGIDAQVTFSPHGAGTAMLKTIGDDIEHNTSSSLLFALAFLYQTKGRIRDAIEQLTEDNGIFVYGISDRPVGGLDVLKPGGTVVVVSPDALQKNVPPPFEAEPTGGKGIRLHDKFMVVDFDKPTARVYMGSYNFSVAADTENGENLLVIRDRRIAVAYAVEAVRLIDHCHFRVAQEQASTEQQVLALAKPPRTPGEKPWWDEDYTVAYKVRDRELFA